MTNEEKTRAIAAMLEDYDLHTGSRAAAGVIQSPEKWVDCEHFPIYQAAAALLLAIREEKTAPAPVESWPEKRRRLLMQDFTHKFNEEFGDDPVIRIFHGSGSMNLNAPAMLEKISKAKLTKIVQLVRADANDDRRNRNRRMMQTFFYQQAAQNYHKSQDAEDQRDEKAARRWRNAAEKSLTLAEAC